MDQFGVQKPELKAIARTPQMPDLVVPTGKASDKPMLSRPHYAWQAQVRNISGLGDRSAYGLPGQYGVLLEKVFAGGPAAKAGLQEDDVILACNGKPVRTVENLGQTRDDAAGKKLTLSVMRKQQLLSFDVSDYAFAATEYQSSPDFKTIPLAPAAAVLRQRSRPASQEPGTSPSPSSRMANSPRATAPCSAMASWPVGTSSIWALQSASRG